MSLPIGFAVRLGRKTRVVDGGRALLGGAPTRLVRLTARARELLDGRELIVRDRAGAVLADRLLETGLADPIIERLAPIAADITLVVPVMDRADELDRLLGSAPAGIRMIVVDDASRRPEPVRAVAERHGAEFVGLAVNVGPGGARNAGLALVQTPFVLFADSDIVFEPDTASVLLKHFADPKVAMAVPRIIGLETEGSGSWVGRYEDARSSLDLGSHPATVRPRSPVAWASTACVVARVAALGDGFSPGMRVGEDVDIGWRLVSAGWRIRYEPSVQAAHEHRVHVGDWLRRKAVYGTAAHPLAERHPVDIAPAVLAPWSAAVILALLAQRRWSLPVAALISAVTAVRIARKLGRTEGRLALGAWLTGNGLVAAIAQAMALLLRHWWPVACIACLLSKRARRAVLVASIADVALEYRKNDAHLDPVRFGVARRLDDVAYGAGVWWAAIRARSIASLKPSVRRQA